MALFSIVVPAHRVENYLNEALMSIREQSFTDFEIIAVDDGSPDACGEIIEKQAADDARIVPIQLEQAHGLGPARNIGMSRANGEYLMFLDGDDKLAPGALEKISHHLEVTSRPDIVLYDYQLSHPCGIDSYSSLRRWIPDEIDQPFQLRDFPHALRVPWTAWNKVYRTSFINRLNLEFPTGYYEDAPWSCPSMAAASSIAVLAEACVHYRTCRPGSITRSKSSQHADMFDQFDRIFTFLDEHPEFEFPTLRTEITKRMALFMHAIGAGNGVIPNEMISWFRDRCVQYFETHKSDHYTGPSPKWFSRPVSLSSTNTYIEQV